MSSRRSLTHISSRSIAGSLSSCLVATWFVAAASGCAPLHNTTTVDPGPGHSADVSSLADYSHLPLSFVANQGQTEAVVQYVASGDGFNLFLTPTATVLSLRAPASAEASANHAAVAHPGATDSIQQDTVVRMRLIGANDHPLVTGVDRLQGTNNYFIGEDPTSWHHDVPTFGGVKFSGVYPDIDQVFYGREQQLEYDFVLSPGADARRITLAFDGVRNLALNEAGDLLLETAGGTLTQHAPVIYQEFDGSRRLVSGRYVLGALDRVTFDIGSYDMARPLIIDPVLSYSTYLGGSGNDVGHAIAVDSADNAYVVGETSSLTFPGVNAGSFQSAKQNSIDVFVTKISATGVEYSTYLGGSGGDYGYAIAVDAAGAAYVTGQTDSPTVAGPGNVAFPGVGALQPLYKGGGDAFVTKISPAGNTLVYSTYLGGGGFERGYGIAVDSLGSAYLTGHTNSDNGSSGPTGGFPTVGALQANNNSPGNSDAFVSKLTPSGNALVYSTYLGGNGSEFSLYGGDIAVDADGNAYVGGSTGSTNFPGANASAIQSTYGAGVSDGFVTKLNSAGGLLFSTYLGGNTYDAVHGLAVNASGEVFVTGYTDSTNFPVFGPTSCVTIYICHQVILQETKGAGQDAFVARLNATGTAFVYSTHLGGNGGEIGYDIAVDSASNAYIAGWTTSTTFPIVAAIQAVNGGSNGDMFVSALDSTGNTLLYSTYLGGNTGSETARGIALDAAANVYLTGDTNSTNFPTAAPVQATHHPSLGTDAVVVKITAVAGLIAPPTDFTVTSVVGNTVTVTWRAPVSGTIPTGYVVEGGINPGQVLASLPTNSTATTYSFSVPTGAFYIRVHALAPALKSAPSNEVRLFVNVPAPPSAPVNLLGLVNGSSLAMAWTNTAAGGAPTGLILDVTGSLTLSVALAVSESFSFANVAAGTYTVSLRASNTLGTSPPSDSVTLTFPGACTGVPQTPANFVVTKNGSVISAQWSLPPSGPAPTSYRLIVSGGFNGELAVTDRRISGAVGPGSYTLTVMATNACGSGAPTLPVAVTIP